MSASKNSVSLIGHIGTMGELKSFPTQDGARSVINFTVATNGPGPRDAEGKSTEKTSWHNVTAFGKLAEIVAQVGTRKGSLVSVDGKLDYSTSTGEKDGKEVIYNNVSIIADEFLNLTPREATAPAQA